MNELIKTGKIISSKVYIYGGARGCERVIAAFGNEESFGYKPEFPISCIEIKPVNVKYADRLTHRDYLGAMMNLGIDRGLIGDIVIIESDAYVFCLKKITEFIVENLTKVRNDIVVCEIKDSLPDGFEPSYKEIVGSVASLRLDALISLAFNESRSKSVSYIENGIVFVNGKVITTNAYNIKEGEIISVRGHGRFMYLYTKSETKKGRYMVVLNLYV